MIFRIYHQTAGGHVHMRVFAGSKDGSLGKCGDLTMRVDEFEDFRRRLENEGVEFRHADGYPESGACYLEAEGMPKMPDDYSAPADMRTTRQMINERDRATRMAARQSGQDLPNIYMTADPAVEAAYKERLAKGEG